jgi:hypothetical protein
MIECSRCKYYNFFNKKCRSNPCTILVKGVDPGTNKEYVSEFSTKYAVIKNKGGVCPDFKESFISKLFNNK